MFKQLDIRKNFDSSQNLDPNFLEELNVVESNIFNLANPVWNQNAIGTLAEFLRNADQRLINDIHKRHPNLFNNIYSKFESSLEVAAETGQIQQLINSVRDIEELSNSFEGKRFAMKLVIIATRFLNKKLLDNAVTDDVKINNLGYYVGIFTILSGVVDKRSARSINSWGIPTLLKKDFINALDEKDRRGILLFINNEIPHILVNELKDSVIVNLRLPIIQKQRTLGIEKSNINFQNIKNNLSSYSTFITNLQKRGYLFSEYIKRYNRTGSESVFRPIYKKRKKNYDFDAARTQSEYKVTIPNYLNNQEINREHRERLEQDLNDFQEYFNNAIDEQEADTQQVPTVQANPAGFNFTNNPNWIDNQNVEEETQPIASNNITQPTVQPVNVATGNPITGTVMDINGQPIPDPNEEDSSIIPVNPASQVDLGSDDNLSNLEVTENDIDRPTVNDPDDIEFKIYSIFPKDSVVTRIGNEVEVEVKDPNFILNIPGDNNKVTPIRHIDKFYFTKKGDYKRVIYNSFPLGTISDLNFGNLLSSNFRDGQISNSLIEKLNFSSLFDGKLTIEQYDKPIKAVEADNETTIFLGDFKVKAEIPNTTLELEVDRIRLNDDEIIFGSKDKKQILVNGKETGVYSLKYNLKTGKMLTKFPEEAKTSDEEKLEVPGNPLDELSGLNDLADGNSSNQVLDALAHKTPEKLNDFLIETLTILSKINKIPYNFLKKWGESYTILDLLDESLKKRDIDSIVRSKDVERAGDKIYLTLTLLSNLLEEITKLLENKKNKKFKNNNNITWTNGLLNNILNILTELPENTTNSEKTVKIDRKTANLFKSIMSLKKKHFKSLK